MLNSNKSSIENISKLNLFFDKIFLINLDKDKLKLYKTNLILEKYKINYIRIRAIDGQNPIIYNQWYLNLLKNKNYKIKSPGAFGYLLTYYYILLDSFKKNYKNILILDDDIIFHKNFDTIINNNEYFNSNSSSFLKDWKLIYFGACHQNHHLSYFNNKHEHNKHENNNHENDKNINENEIQIKNPKLFNIYDFLFKYGNGNIDGTHTIGINQCVIKELIYLIRNTTYPIDSGPFNYIYKKYPHQCFIFYPHLSIQRCEKSSIQNYKNLDKFNNLTKTWGWNYNDYDF